MGVPRGVDWMYTRVFRPLRGETSRAGDPAYAMTVDRAMSLVNEGFATHARGAGTRGMGVCQRDGLRKDTGSEETVTHHQPGVEPPRRTPHTDAACVREPARAPRAPGHEAAQLGSARGP